MPHTPQHSPYRAPEKVYGAAAQDAIPPDETAKLDEEKIKLIQQVIGVYLYYGRAVDNTILPAFSAIASEQSEATKRTMEKKFNSWIISQHIQPPRSDFMPHK